MAISNLKLSRVRAGLSQLELAIKTGIHPSRVSLAERGLAILDTTEVEQIARTLYNVSEFARHEPAISMLVVDPLRAKIGT